MPGDWSTDLAAALRFPLTSWARLALAFALAALTYALLVASTAPEYSLQMLGANPGYAGEVLASLTRLTYQEGGLRSLGLVTLYAGLTGVAFTNMVAQLRTVGISGATGAAGVLPGLVASGCASCGAGLLGFLGFAGAMTVLPFGGDLVRLAGILLLGYFLARAGDPRYCDVPA